MCSRREPTDFFSFFGLPRRLQLDEAALEREFYALSRKLHPDVYSRASAREQAWSLEKTSQLNDAYRTLKDPISRTEYLLQAGRHSTGGAEQDRNRKGARCGRGQEADGSGRVAGRSL